MQDADNVQAVILVKNGFEDAEVVIVLDVLRRMQIKVQLVSCEDTLELKSYWGMSMQADTLFTKIKNQTFNAVIVVGGPANTSALEQDQAVIDFIKYHMSLNKIIAAECSAPAKVLGHNGLIANRTYTCSSGLESTVHDQSSSFVDAPVVLSGNLITCKGLAHTFVFAGNLAVALGCSKEAVCDQLDHIYLPQEQIKLVE